MPTALTRALKVLALALICYCLLGFLILPGMIQRIASQQLAEQGFTAAIAADDAGGFGVEAVVEVVQQ